MLEIMRGTTPTITCHVDADLRNYVCKLEFGQPNTPNVTVEDPTISYSSGSSTLVFIKTNGAWVETEPTAVPQKNWVKGT